ncbi:LCP family protein [Brevibacillus humidisoli]|uniref:LCP family protein n=1 Tax=Brevibacillus humidisoli TaxID=2895522 RepID=UPI001E4E723D|nr:LCP family protein [Brevibacillus humidisoli]UFJ39135.1 LCP family protein [Brevibacillus humidisoli]
MKRLINRRAAKPVIGLLILAIVCSAAGYTFYTAYQFKKMTREWYQSLSKEPSALTESDTDLKQEQPEEQGTPLFPKPRPLKPFTLLLIGVDSREGERARSDTMMLAAVHPVRQRIYLLSIPRDSYMELPGRGFDKVNHAMAYGGPALLKETLEQYFDVPIDRYITVDFEGFRQVVDELGGIQVNIKKRMKYTDPTDGTRIDLEPGLQVLNGKQALDYARYRKSDIGREDSDAERISRQQEILQALVKKGESLQGVIKVFSLMDILGGHVKTDLSEAEIASLLISYRDSQKNLLLTDTLKGQDQRIWKNGLRVWYYLVEHAEKERIQHRLLEELKGKTAS